MLVRARQLGFRPERFRLYQRLQGLLGEEFPYISLYARLQWMVARPEVRAVRLDSGGLHHLERMWIEAPAPPPAPAVSDPSGEAPAPGDPSADAPAVGDPTGDAPAPGDASSEVPAPGDPSAQQP
jgi:hypothetical protein